LWHAEAACVDRSHRLLVADANNHRICVFHTNGTFIKSFGSIGFGNGEFNCPQSVKCDSQGQFWVVDMYNHRLQVFDREGVFLRTVGSRGSGPGELEMPCGLFIDSRDRVFITDIGNARIQVLDASGSFLFEIRKELLGLSKFGILLDVALDEAHGILYTTDAGDNVVHKLALKE
jgi:DNA-binding beta-propeller fold protein YncE